jgi:hypothetical protein
MFRFRTTRTLLISALVSGALVAPTSSAAAAEPDDTAGLTDSSRLSTPIVAGGNVLGPDSAPAARQKIVLYAWPSNDVSAAAVVGDTLALSPVAKGTTATDGSFQLRIDSWSNLVPHAGTDNIVNFEILSSGSAPYSFSRKLLRTSGGGATTTLAATTSASVDADGYYPDGTDGSSYRLADPTASQSSLRVAPVTVTLSAEPTTTPEDISGAETSDESATETAPPPDNTVALTKGGCSSTVVKDLGTTWSLVGQHYSTTSGVTADFIYTASANSTIGILLSYSGNYGSWTTGGSTTKSSSGSIDYPALSGPYSAYRDTLFRFAKYRLWCTTNVGWGNCLVRDPSISVGRRQPHSLPRADHGQLLRAEPGWQCLHQVDHPSGHLE